MFTSLLSVLDDSRPDVLAATGRPLVLSLGIRRAWAELFGDDPRVDELFIVERKGRHAGVGGIVKLGADLKAGDFDAVIIGPPSLRAGLAARLGGIPSRVGYRADGRSLLLTTGMTPARRGQQHYAREMVALGEAWLSSAGVDPARMAGATPDPSLPGCAAMKAAAGNHDRPWWVLAPGTTYGEAKTWPPEKARAFLRLATREQGVRLVLLGDAAARGFSAKLRDDFEGNWGEDLDGSTDVVDLTGRTDLKAAVGVLKAAQAFIGNDSGLMHVAAALGLPTVGIFGSSNPDWTSPVGPRTGAVVPEGFSCRPCYRKTCNQPVFCLETIEAAAVLATVRQLTATVPEKDN